MRTICKNVYSFDELSEEAKEKAIEELRNINVEHDWWIPTYEDAENIGLKLTGFELDRRRSAYGEFILSACEVAENILNCHGDQCQTRQTAEQFLESWQPLYNEYLDENSEHYESRERENELSDLEEEFLKSLLEDYSIILQNESEYLTEDEAIIETIEANEYEFYEDGSRA